MVIVRLTGGLGNQLFQYATAFRLAHVSQSLLKLDVSSYIRNPHRTYALTLFNISSTRLADSEELRPFQGRERVRQLKHWLNQKKWLRSRWRWVKQPSLHYFMQEVLGLRGDIYLDGIWQSEKYFQDIAPVIRAEFTLNDKLAGRNEIMARAILSTSAVSMHIRRGDYISNPATRSLHEVCSLDYYERALRLLTEVEPKPHIFVFSDDPGWVRENIRFPFPITVVDHNPPEQAHEDLRLMGLCRHHIIANSSFSWWGAWLCQYPDKTVFAPNRWFNTAESDVSDIVPSSWKLVEV
jgi:hypothetical protein